MPTWSNWSGRQTASPSRVVTPARLDDFIDAVADARSNGWTVRAVGASHSHSRVAAPDGMLVETDGWQGVLDHRPAGPDGASPTVTVRSGTRIHQLGEPLHHLGYGLINQGDIDRQSIAGAIGTGTHGTGPGLGNFSTSVVGLTVVLSDGSVVTCSAQEEQELFNVARHSLGAVGLITEVQLAVRDRYRLEERQWIAPPDDVFPDIDRLIAETRHFEFFWVPNRDLCACKSLDELTGEDGAEAVAASFGPGEIAEVVEVAKRVRRGWSHQIISSIRGDRHTEIEYSIPAEAGPACFLELREMIGSRFPDLMWPLEYRTVAADDLMISAARGRPTVTISAHQDISLDDRPLFTACEEIFRSYDGRPHWGKVHYRTGDELAALHDRYREWWDLRDRYDPEGLFVTEDLAALRPGG
ncbi:MAG: D-arabinono-1,4-lactone oxidase [Actinomycetota bacterium]